MALTLALAEQFIAAAKTQGPRKRLGHELCGRRLVPGIWSPWPAWMMPRWLTTGVAQSKAFTAATFRRTSREVAELAESRSQLFASVSEIIGRPLLLAGGGLPLSMNGEFLGGVGASGGTEDEDIECARAALDAIGAE